MARHSNDTEEMSEDSTARSGNHHIFQRLGVEEDESTKGGESDTNSYTSEEMSEDSTARSGNHRMFQRLGVEEDESTEEEESDTNSYTSKQLPTTDDDVTFSNKDMLDCNFCYKSLSVVVFEVFFFFISSGFCFILCTILAIYKLLVYYVSLLNQIEIFIGVEHQVKSLLMIEIIK